MVDTTVAQKERKKKRMTTLLLLFRPDKCANTCADGMKVRRQASGIQYHERVLS